jgi:hypothetical protein
VTATLVAAHGRASIKPICGRLVRFRSKATLRALDYYGGYDEVIR